VLDPSTGNYLRQRIEKRGRVRPNQIYGENGVMANPKIAQFKKVLQMDPNDETMWFGLGKAYMGDENWPEAVSALERCIDVKPTYSAAYLALAQCLRQTEAHAQCHQVCTDGIQVATGNGDLLVIKQLEELKKSLP
jgi:cytochrome c-type biogenesis protein CcmH/NrfG